MRDPETAQIGIRAALTGHLVLTTLHTNDCPSTVARLLDMGIPPFLVSPVVRLNRTTGCPSSAPLRLRETVRNRLQALATHS